MYTGDNMLYGLQQKDSTHQTILLIQHISKILGVEAMLLGQGENQVVALSVKEGRLQNDESIAILAQQFVRQLQRWRTRLGMEVKTRKQGFLSSS